MTNGQLLSIGVSFFVGIVVADQWLVHDRFYIVVLVLMLVMALVWRQTRWFDSVIPSVIFLIGSISCCALLIGVLRMEYAESRFDNSSLLSLVGQSVELTGQVVAEPDVRESFTQIYVRAGEEVILVRGTRFVTFTYGDTVQVTGVLTRPESFQTDTGSCLLYTSPSPRDGATSRMPSSA